MKTPKTCEMETGETRMYACDSQICGRTAETFCDVCETTLCNVHSIFCPKCELFYCATVACHLNHECRTPAERAAKLAKEFADVAEIIAIPTVTEISNDDRRTLDAYIRFLQATPCWDGSCANRFQGAPQNPPSNRRDGLHYFDIR